MYTPPSPRETSAASTLALAACCVNSFLISAYHFISTFQRKAQCERCHVHVQEERTASNSASKSRRGVRKCCVIVAQSGKRKKKKECQLQLPGSQFTKMPNHSGPRKSRLHKKRRERKEHRREAVEERAACSSCCCGNWRSLGNRRRCLSVLLVRRLQGTLPLSLFLSFPLEL